MKLKELIGQYGEYEVSDELIAQFKKPKPKTVWELEKGDNYFVIYNDGDVMEYKWCDSALGKSYRDRGWAFLTREEAEWESERRKVETLLLKHGGRRWHKKDGDNWFVYLDEYNLVSRSRTKAPYQGMIYFDTHKEAVEACEKIGTSRIKDALFEVR